MQTSFRYVIGSDNFLWVYRVLHPQTGVPLTDVATSITAQIFDETGLVPIAGTDSDIPLTFAYVANTKSDYRCVVPGSLPVIPAKYYPVRVDITIAGLHTRLGGTMFAVMEDY